MDVDSERTYGVSTGVDIGFGFGESFALRLGSRWLDASVESPVLPNGVDPLFTRVGVAFRF